MLARNQKNRPKASVGICIATFQRPELLRLLLAGLAKLKFKKMPVPDIDVIVVDNDVKRSAEKSCGAMSLPWPLRYVVEPRRGIAQARNRAIEEAGERDYITFIDDDEVPTPLWLDELLWTSACFAADVVCGSVLPSYAAGVPEWVKAGGYFSKHVYVTGQPLETCSSGNVLISRRVLAAVHAFDDRFALTGAEDTHFFLRTRQAGFEMVGSGGAIVYEAVPKSRASLRWVLRRAYQVGNSWVLCEFSLDPRRSTRFVRTIKACGRILQGSVSACISPIFGRVALANALQNLFLGAGMLTALAGRSYQAYESAGDGFGQVNRSCHESRL
jgi:succinoglycan biosynthesis protein ExoM